MPDRADINSCNSHQEKQKALRLFHFTNKEAEHRELSKLSEIKDQATEPGVVAVQIR